MTEFLSEGNIELHREYTRGCALRYSILEKSIPGISNKSMDEILRMPLSRAERGDILSLLPELELHRLYFLSFAKEKNPMSARIREQFGSEVAFLNLLYRLAMGIEYGFIVVRARGRKIECLATKDYSECFMRGTPMLAIDVCEHAYFRDYGFDKRGYLVNALPYLNINAIDQYLN